MTKEVSEIAASDPDAIMLVANAPEGVVVANALLSNPALSNKPVIAHWGIAGGNFVNAVGLEQLSRLNVSTIQTFSFLNAYDQSKASEVLSAYQSTYDPNASQENIQGVVGFAQAYDLVHMLALAIKSAESIERPKVRDALEALETYHGLIKHYEKPFSPDQHDALLRDDYFMAAFNENGNLVPN
ncbi:hypothetical protein A3758_31455 [Oleiphilus sp. HI0118]|nr:hypothetical protein A3758_31455 [Oleiphilus sp. HI0118]